MSIVTKIATIVAKTAVATASASCEAYHITASTGKVVAKAASHNNKVHKNNRAAFMAELEKKVIK